MRLRPARRQPATTVEPEARDTVPPATELRWIDMAADDAHEHPTTMADIANRGLDGITVSGLFTAAECARAVEVLEQHGADTVPAMFGTMLGMSLANVAEHSGSPSDRTPYLDDAEMVMKIYDTAFGGDPFDRVASVVSMLADGQPAAAPSEGGRPYLAGSIRWMVPGGRSLPAHVGNEFQLGNEAYSHLSTTTRIEDHYSWFVILQEPEQGGALSVFDLLADSHQPADPQWSLAGRDDKDFDAQPGRRVAPPAGSLVLFGGGWRWHRVERIQGSRPRITYGGFAGPSIDGTAIHSWF